MMNQRIDVTSGLRRAIDIDSQAELTWPDKPCRITVVSPRIVRLLHRTLRVTQTFPVDISITEYLPPVCSQQELTERVNQYLRLPNLPSFLREIRDELSEVKNEDPYKSCERLFCAGLDERYILERI